MGKGIHWELCKKLKFDYANTWYMLNPESENEKHERLQDFELQTNHLISTRSDLEIVNKKKKRIADVTVPPDHKVKIKENEKKDKYLGLAREQKPWNIKGTVILIEISAFGRIPKGLVRELKKLKIGRQAETIRTTVLFRSARILRGVPVWIRSTIIIISSLQLQFFKRDNSWMQIVESCFYF